VSTFNPTTVGIIDAGIIAHASLMHQEGTSGTQGGGVDPSTRVLILGLTQPTQINFVSSNIVDVEQTYLLEGIGTTGIVETESIQLLGTTTVTSVREFVKILRITKQSGELLVGNVTVFTSSGEFLASLFSASDSGSGFEVTGIQSLSNRLFSTPDDGRVYYEKFFIRNSTLDVLSNFVVEKFSDSDNCFDFALDLTVNATTTSRNRTTRPGAIPIQNFNSLPKTLANFCSNDAIGVWLRIQIPSGATTSTKTLTLKTIADNQETLLDVIVPQAPSAFVANVVSRRASEPLGGGLPLRFMELRGAHFVDQLFYEPDPVTFRSQFYYNTRINKLFKKINSKPRPVWKQVR